jgi:hypothetical protein
MIRSEKGHMRTIFGSRIFWIGVALLIIGTGPLLVSVMYLRWQGDDNPNPIGLGLLAMFTFWPSMILIAIGVGLGIVRYLGWIDR